MSNSKTKEATHPETEERTETLPTVRNGEMDMTEWALMKEQATMLIKTGFIPASLNTAEKVIAVMLTARELHIGKMEALRSINIIQGKPCMSVQLMLALAQRTGQVKDVSIKEDATGAHVSITRKGQSTYTAHFGPTQAKALGLIGKDNYLKQAATMYRWRAIAEAVRFTFPDAVCGLYTPEEMGAPVIVTTDGDVVVDTKALGTEHDPVVDIADGPIGEPQTIVDPDPEPDPRPPEPTRATPDKMKRMKNQIKGASCGQCHRIFPIGIEIIYDPSRRLAFHVDHLPS